MQYSTILSQNEVIFKCKCNDQRGLEFKIGKKNATFI